MGEPGTADAIDSAQPLPLEPFSFLAGVRSKVAGLGGADEGPDPDYVFHTEYVEVAEGNANFHVGFRGLRGKLGSVVLRIHMYQRGDTDARLVTSARILISRLVQLGGVYDMRFEAFHGVRYALYCAIQGMTDAAADALELSIDRPATADEVPQTATEARNSAFGRGAVEPSTHIISIERARLALPVSQLCTGPQLRERSFQELSRRFVQPATLLDKWGAAYVLQVLDQYGVLAAGARGLGFGATNSPVAAMVAESDASVVVVDRQQDVAAGLAGLQSAASTDADGFRRNVSYRAADGELFARDLVNFDFLWTDRVISRLSSVAEGIGAAQKAMASLRPGGLAVHLIDYALSPEAVEDVPGIAPFQRRDLDRLALVLISRNYEVAQIKVDRQNAPTIEMADGRAPTGIALCGLIVRKAQTIE